MPKRRLRKSLQDYLNKIKNPHPNNNNSNSSPQNPKTKPWFLSACKFPIKTQSFAQDRTVLNPADEHRDRGVTLADIDKFLLENFRSLCVEDNDDNKDDDGDRRECQDSMRLDFNSVRFRKKGKERTETRSKSKEPVPIFFESPRFLLDPPPDVSGSSRFFITRASSSSLIEEARSSLTVTEADNASTFSSSTARNHHDCDDEDTELETEEVKLPDDCIAILTQSRSPYDDFKRSMKEMVEARARTQDKRIDWDFMEELLFCYLRLNEKKSYKYILSAFVDVIMALRRKSRRMVARAARVPARSSERFLDSSGRIARRKNNINNNNNNESRRRENVA